MKSADIQDQIYAARSGIDKVFLDTPQFKADVLSAHLGKAPILKVETVNPIRSFKGRGACLLVGAAEPNTPLVCASVGNFGQGMAYAARVRGVPLTVFLAEDANPLKVERIRSLGATVVQYGADFDAAKSAARDFAHAKGHAFVEDGAASAITIGAGTIGMEMLASKEKLGAIVVPVGNGALLNGVASWIKTHQPGVRVIGVCSRAAPAMAMSWKEGRSISTAETSTVAEGIAVREPVPEAVDLMQELADDILLVSDKSMIQAVQLCFQELGLLVEPAGAAGLAALIEHPDAIPEVEVATILCGGNVSKAQVKAWIS
ncbi:threonine ammonia-lyase [Parasphingorhabdus cellanae]|uniref:Pyridoxal-phosphate dependent enzyme n=1 Tax=Parasphingorhabdus cellanae TaxID=2806553 RepID=A0ABX7T9Q1_9SPHN|nr:pyridoxal-phosphate dependent enzyme [Parasphingorhabdus cellanae]QTD57317.1 pyridoxal-phosphate dependent enzyme [Parasphingorhabdus cellanae]